MAGQKSLHIKRQERDEKAAWKIMDWQSNDLPIETLKPIAGIGLRSFDGPSDVLRIEIILSMKIWKVSGCAFA